MSSDILASAIIQSMAHNFSVSDLIGTVETLKQSGRTDSVRALYAIWISHNQENPLLFAVLFNYSVALMDMDQLDAAQDCLQRAIALNPDFIPPYINLGRIYERLGKVGMAIQQWSAALAKTSAINGTSITHKTTALNQSARALEAANQDESAEEFLRQSLDVDPHQREVIQHLMALRQRQCERPILLPTERAGMQTLMEGMSPLSAAAYTDDPLFQLALDWNYNRIDVGNLTEAALSWPKAEASSAPLKIGYLSSDLRDHAVGYLMAEVFGLHDRTRVEVFAYYCGPEAKDALHQSFQDAADHWVSIRDMDDAAAAKRIAEDGIQILVDLNGYTREARLKLVALRPAPVIVNWLGFPGSMASPYHHYILADEWIIPEENEMYYSEKVLRLPCYQPNNRKRVVAPLKQTRSEVGLPEKGMVYCCFNGAHKITRFTFDRWMSILARVPDSVLWLLNSSDTVNERLKGYAAERGIAPERIIFAQKAANPYHLARYVLADLILDTTPYGAHTTASDALWMGVPVLTLSGRSFASRVCGSLVLSAGLPELITTSADAFVELAVELGTDPALLQSFRDRLHEQRDSCTLFDTPLLVRELERLYQQMWNQYKADELPCPDLSNLDVYLEVGSRINHEETEVQMVQDYHAWWREKLALRSRFRRIAPDHRLVTAPESRTESYREKLLTTV